MLGLATRILRANGVADEVIIDAIRSGAAVKMTPPSAPREHRRWARSTLDRWERSCDESLVDHVFAGRTPPSRDWKKRQALAYAMREPDWIPVYRSVGVMSGEFAEDSPAALQDTAERLERQREKFLAMRETGIWTFRHPDGTWINYRPEDADGYCELLESKIAALRDRFRETDRQRVVGAWLRDLKPERPRPADYLADQISRNPAAEEIMRLVADERRETQRGPRPSAGDAWGRWRPQGEDEQSGHLERDLHANPTLDAVLAKWGEWPERLAATLTEPAEDVRNGQPWMPRRPRPQHGAGPLELELPCRDPWKVEQLLGGLLTRTHKDRRSSSAAPLAAGRILLALAKELDAAVTAAESVTDSTLARDCAASIERAVLLIDAYLKSAT